MKVPDYVGAVVIVIRSKTSYYYARSLIQSTQLVAAHAVSRSASLVVLTG